MSDAELSTVGFSANAERADYLHVDTETGAIDVMTWGDQGPRPVTVADMLLDFKRMGWAVAPSAVSAPVDAVREEPISEFVRSIERPNVA